MNEFRLAARRWNRPEFAAIRSETTRGFDRMDDRVQWQFTWIVGIQPTMIVTMIAVLAAAFFRTL